MKSTLPRAFHKIAFLSCLALPALSWSAKLASAEADAIEDGSWTLVVLPDTQVYANKYPQYFDDQTKWIIENARSHNIKMVLHEGDITDDNIVPQWDNALHSMSMLDGLMPYAMAPGNHDYGPGGNAADRASYFNEPKYFGPGTPYSQQATVGGFFEADKSDNSFHTFEVDGQKWLVVALEWAPRDEVVAWANKIVSEHPDHLAMLVTHAYMYYDESRYDWDKQGKEQSWNPKSYPIAKLENETINDGEDLWEKLVSKHKNFRLVFNGHVLGDGTGFLSSAGQEGQPVHQMLANYQFKKEGGMGDMRLLEFKKDGNTVVVRTYSPVLERHDRAFDQEFTLKLNELHEPLAAPEKVLEKAAVP